MLILKIYNLLVFGQRRELRLVRGQPRGSRHVKERAVGIEDAGRDCQVCLPRSPRKLSRSDGEEKSHHVFDEPPSAAEMCRECKAVGSQHDQRIAPEIPRFSSGYVPGTETIEEGFIVEFE